MAYLPLSVTILSRNRLEHTKRNMDILLPMVRNGEIELIVVDNASTDGTRGYLDAMCREHECIVKVFNAENKGAGQGRNDGFFRATRPFILALDEDTSVCGDDIRCIPGILEDNPGVGIAALRVRQTGSGEILNYDSPEVREIANHGGAAFAIRTELAVRTGGIDRECDFGAVEINLAIKVHACGFTIIYWPHIEAVHYGPVGVKNEPWRYQKRVYNFTRTFYRFLPRRIARVHAFRFWFSYMLSWRRTFGLQGMASLLGLALAGRKAGKASYQPVPDETVSFYHDPGTRPDMGNVPITQKAFGRRRAARR